MPRLAWASTISYTSVPVGASEILGLISMGDVLASHAAEDNQLVHHLKEYMYGRY